MTATTAAAVARKSAEAKPAAPGTTPGRPAPKRSGVSLFAQEKSKRGPVRFINQKETPDSQKNRRGKGKKVVQRHDVLYGVDRRRGRGKGRGASRSGLSTAITTPAAHKRVVKVHGTISVADLADALGVKGGVVMKALIGMGVMVTLNEHVDLETAQVIAQEFDYEAEDVSFNEEDVLFGVAESEDVEVDEGVGRAPIVTIMGHVDHGKTTLLDAIRSTAVADGEAGGITQHISAFDVEAGGQQITFVDTPGHAAFTAMRARGAQVTDIVVLVVAVTEGVMPQTVEVISHAKAAEVPIIVALNKIDMPEANADRCRQQLSEHELISEDWGGDVQMVELSAKEGTGVENLLESISLQAEIMELKAPADCSAQGRVVEAQLEKGRGPVAVAIVQKGTLRRGDVVVAGTVFGKVRALTATGGSNAKIKAAGPSSPVCILGLAGLPSAGDEFVVVKSEKDAKLVTEHRRDEERANSAANIKPRVSLDDVFARLKEGEAKELNLIVKADVQGSVEAVKQVLSEIEVRDVKIRILHSAVGGVTEGDVTLASASEAVIVGFCVRPDAKARALAEEEGVDVRTYRVIYKAVDEIKQALVGLLEPEFVEKVMGHAEVREVFKVSKVGAIAGSSIQDGKVNRNQQARLLRNSVVVWEGKIGSLRRFKDDVREVLQGYECGIGLDGYDDVKVDDIIETFVTEEVRPTI
jgi:translation initiation factor IF-2